MMRFCTCHWNSLRKAVDDRGMTHLVARSGEDAVENQVAELEGRATPANWDPLMAAHWAIAGKVMDAIGHSQGPEAALAFFGSADGCPLCEVQRSYDWWGRNGNPPPPAEAKDAQAWIDSCMDAMRAHAVEIGLIAGLQ